MGGMGLCVGKTAKAHFVSAWLCGYPLTACQKGFHEAKIVSQKPQCEGDFKVLRLFSFVVAVIFGFSKTV